MPVNLTDIQKRAIEVPDGVIVVTAGAGTGKTTVLAETVARKMVAEDRVDIRDLLVLTFTVKAAAEMSQRISSRLKELAGISDDQFEKDWLMENASNVPDAAIETIDAFAQRLLREHAMDSGIDPAFSILSPERDRELGYRIAKECLERWLEEPPHEKWRDAAKEIAINDWPGALYTLHQFIVTRGEPTSGLFLLGREGGSRDEVNEVLESYRKEIQARYDSILQKLSDGIEALRESLDETSRLVSKKGEVPKYAILAGIILADVDALEEWLRDGARGWDDPIVRKAAFWKLWGGNFKEDSAAWQSRELCKEVKLHLGGDGEVKETLKSLWIELKLWELRPALGAALLEYHGALIAARRRGNLLTFADSEIEALKLLYGHKAVREQCNEKYRYVIVDEYQDINPLQQDLIYKLCRTSDETGLPANLYIVGDERQSIYGFRDADFTLLRDLHTRMKDENIPNSGSRPLYENFRSRPEILNFANHIFRHVWGRSGEDGDVTHTDLKAMFPPYLESTADGMADRPRIELDLVVADNAETGRRREASVLARRLSEIVRGGEIEITAKGCGGETSVRPIEWGDCAILIRKTSPFRLYEEEFSKLGIPYVTESGGGFFDTPEIADITALLYSMSPARSDLDLAILLRSPWVGLSDDALVQIAEEAGGKGWEQKLREVRLSDKKDGRRLERFNRWYIEAQGIAGRVPVYRLIEKALESSGYIDRVFAADRGRNARANIEKLIRTFRDEANIYDSFEAAEYLRWLRNEKVNAAQAGVAPAGGEGAVTLATVHASKGREWPLVIVACLGGRGPRGPGGREILWDRNFGIAFRAFEASGGDDGKSLSYLLAAERASERDESEQKRVLYVAMTRAREYLILSSHISVRKAKGENSWRREKGSWLAIIDEAMSEGEFSVLGTPEEMEHPRVTLEYNISEPREPGSDSSPLGSESRTYPLRLARFYFTGPDGNRDAVRVTEALGNSLRDLEAKLRILPVTAGISANRYMVTATEISTFERCPRMYAYRALWHAPQKGGIRKMPISGIAETEEETAYDPESVQPENFEMPASSWGTLAHRLMEEIPLDSDAAKIQAHAEKLFAHHGHDKEIVVRLTQLVSNTLGLEIFKRLINYDLRREFRLLGKLPGTTEVVLGTIDLLAVCDNKIIVIDYKSGQIDPGEASDRTKSYTLQLALYAHLAASWRKIAHKNVEAHIVFLDPATDVEVPLDSISLGHSVEVVKSLSKASEERNFSATPSLETCRRCDYRDICVESMAL